MTGVITFYASGLSWTTGRTRIDVVTARVTHWTEDSARGGLTVYLDSAEQIKLDCSAGEFKEAWIQAMENKE